MQSSDQAVSVSRFASLGPSSFYHGQVTDGNNDTVLMFATDGQLEVLRSSRLIFIDSTFCVEVPRLYFDSGAYTRVQFLRAVSHSVGDHVLPEDVADNSDTEDDDEARTDSDSDQPQSAVSVPQAQDLCEVCMVQRARRTTCFCAMWAPAVLCILRGTTGAAGSSRLPDMPH